MAVNLLPAHVPIGYVNNDINQPIYASAELTRALTTMMQQIGGQSTSGPGEVTNLVATGISQGIRVTATLPANNTLAYLEAWVSSDAILGNAVLEAQSQGLQASWDWVPLSSADGVKYIWVRCISKSGKAGAFVGPVSAEAGLNTVPGAVTGLSATPIIGGIRISGTLPTDLDLAYVEIWENTVNNVNTATFLDQGLKSSYDRLNLLTSAGTRYYWVRCVNTSGAKGAFVGPVSAIAGQVQSGNIASGAVAVAAFASGIEPVTIVSSVPSVLSTKTVFNTTNGKLYKWNGSAYIATTPTTDLSGQISAGQIAANAVTAGTIAANAVTAGTIAAAAVSTNELSSAAIFAGSLAVNGTTGMQLVNGTQVGIFKLDGSGNLIIQGTASNKQIKILAPNAGGVAVDDFSTTGQTALDLYLPGGTYAGQWTSNGTAMKLSSQGSDMILFAGTTGNNTLALDCGQLQINCTSITFGSSAKLVTATSALAAGNASGNVPVSNGTVNTNLNADKLDGFDATHFTTDGTGVGTTLNGFSSGTGTGTFVSTTKPGTSTNNSWFTINVGGTLYDFPVWPR
jgi:hypothetical protein